MTRPLFFYFASLLLANGTFLPGKKGLYGCVIFPKKAWKNAKEGRKGENFPFCAYFSFLLKTAAENRNSRKKEEMETVVKDSRECIVLYCTYVRAHYPGFPEFPSPPLQDQTLQ